jgi:DNA polymerase III sliding clamp (beta) subunit (PCNA family)
MQRKDLLARLIEVEPALANHDLIPVMTHFWFTGTHIMAFNDRISIEVPCKTDFIGAVPKTLLDLMKNSKARDVELTPIGENEHLQVKAASSRLKLAVMPAKSFIFEMPKPSDATLPLKNKLTFFDAIETCLRSVGADTSLPDQLGVTLIPDGNALKAYATNGNTISQAHIPLTAPAAFKNRVIIPTSFCEQLLKMARTSGKPMHFEVRDDHVLAVMGGVSLFGRLIEADNPLNFEKIIAYHYSDKMIKGMVPIPSKLRLILERAVIIAGGDHNTSVTCQDGVMKFVSKTDRGECTDTLQVGSQHPDVSVKIEPQLLRAGYEFFDYMVVAKTCVIMSRDSMLYLVSATGG